MITADPGLDAELIQCPHCGATYNIVNRRQGPTCLCFTDHEYRVVCLVCYHRAKHGRSQQTAINNWNEQIQQFDIKARRLELGMTLEDIAELAGVGNAAWSGWEQGIHQPTAVSKRKIAVVLGCDASEI